MIERGRRNLLLAIAAIALLSLVSLQQMGFFEAVASFDPAMPERQAAEQGSAAAQYALGQKLLQSSDTDAEKAEAFSWISKSAAQHYPDAMRVVGVMYLHGIGVEKSSGEAISWLTRAHDASDSMAAYLIGRIYAEGNGVEEDYSKAVSWFTRAAERGSSDANYALGDIYQWGRGNIEKNLSLAARHFSLAAKMGHTYAQYELGWLYTKGEGVEQSLDDAVTWYKRSAGRGYWLARNNLAWLLSTSERESIRDGATAIEYAKAIDLESLDQGDQVVVLDTLAAAHAEAGNFSEAVDLQRRVVAMNQELKKDQDRIKDSELRLQSFIDHKPWRE